MDIRETLETGLVSLGIEYTGKQIEMLLLHIVEIERWNTRWNIVRASGIELVIKHTLDSLSGLPVIRAIPEHATILDIGSGAGFPGLPLAVFLPDSRFTLVERSSKRSVFLRSAAILLGLRNIEVRSDDYTALSAQFDIVTFRAFSALPPEIGSIASRLSSNGKIVAYKGRLAKANVEAEEIAALGYRSNVVPLTVPYLDEERCLVIAENR
jgi:16S rRNA (guanine527-N7)-methyltransferase